MILFHYFIYIYMWTKKCPNCAEEIKSEAKVCIHCWREVNKPIFTKWVINLIIFAIAFLIVAIMFWNIEEKSFWNPVTQEKSLGN